MAVQASHRDPSEDPVAAMWPAQPLTDPSHPGLPTPQAPLAQLAELLLGQPVRTLKMEEEGVASPTTPWLLTPLLAVCQAGANHMVSRVAT